MQGATSVRLRLMEVDVGMNDRAEVLRAERERAGLSQTALAKKLKVSQTWVARVERGARDLTIGEFLATCTIIGRDPIAVFRAVVRD